MKIKHELGSRDSEIARKLYVLAEELEVKASSHLKQIVSQLPDYDIHDAEHSQCVLENIEKLLNENMKKLSCFELFFIYMSSYFHDAAMALPEWEVKLLEMTEGYSVNEVGILNNDLSNDFKKPLTFSKAIEFISSNKGKLYLSFEKTDGYIFRQPNENDHIAELAKLLIEYQNYRNGHIAELKSIRENNDVEKYKTFSKEIRYNFIRDNHAKRICTYILCMSDMFEKKLDGGWGRAIANDLAHICSSHGEDIKYISELEESITYIGNEKTNLQFCAYLLRLGDILHFSFDRAPKTLFASKGITNDISIKHWETKFEGLNYAIEVINNRLEIRYSVYCSKPSSYNFISDYLDWIDIELSSFSKYLSNLRYKESNNALIDKYFINLPECVNRDSLRYDNSNFTPVRGLRFSLDQSKILDMLMGTGLYKEKMACIRELYQNSLDACKCQKIIDGNKYEGNIEFGISREVVENIDRKFFYCLDNGIGMDKRIVEQYFLNIGNSFYNSREFNAFYCVDGRSFSPTSQFGIGVLSSFMIADRMEVITKTRDSSVIKITIENTHSGSYYSTPSEIERELLGSNGTYIKIFLKQNIEMIDDYYEDFICLSEITDNIQLINRWVEKKNKSWNNHIIKHVTDYIFRTPAFIDVIIRLSNHERVSLPSGLFEKFEVSKLTMPLIKISDEMYTNFNREFITTLLFKNNVSVEKLKEKTENVEFEFYLNLPVDDISLEERSCLSLLHRFELEGQILVDGIKVDMNSSLMSGNNFRFDEFMRSGCTNFTGGIKPKLSVDRHSIVEIPFELQSDMNNIKLMVAKSIAKRVSQHLSSYMSLGESTINLFWNYIMSNYSSISLEIVNELITMGTEYLPVMTTNTSHDNARILNEVTLEGVCSFTNPDFRYLSSIESAIIHTKLLKCKEINLVGNELVIKSDEKIAKLSKIPHEVLDNYGRLYIKPINGKVNLMILTSQLVCGQLSLNDCTMQ